MSRPAQVAAEADQLPPNALEAEQGVLGCCLLDPASLSDVEDRTGGAPEVFYDVRHQVLWTALRQMDAAGQVIDLVTVQQWLKQRASLEEAGGLAYIAALPEAVPSAANLIYYLEIIVGQWKRRRLIALAMETVELARRDTRPEAEIAETVEARLTEAAADARQSPIHSPLALVQSITDELEAMHAHRNHDGMAGVHSLATGISFLDKRTAGLDPGTVFVLGAPSSTGKTATITSVLLNVAIKQGKPVTFQSMEMTAKAIMLRIWCNLANANFHRVRTGFFNDAEFQRMIGCAAALSRAPIFIDDLCGISSDTLRSRGRRMVRAKASALHCIDHISEVRNPWNRGDENRDASDAIYAARDIARQTGVPVLAACQCTKEATKAERPTVSHLRASGHIIQVADYIGMLHRDEKREQQSQEQDNWSGFDSEGVETERLITLHLDKQRNGPVGPVYLRLRVQPMIMEDASHGGRGTMRGNR